MLNFRSKIAITGRKYLIAGRRGAAIRVLGGFSGEATAQVC